MNIILFSQKDLRDGAHSNEVMLYKDDHRFKHIARTLKSQVGDTLQVGWLNDKIGTAKITHFSEEKIALECHCQQTPPAPSPVELILALPRPKVLGRTIRTIVEMGVKKIHLIQSARVEKSYWTAHQLKEDYLNVRILEALEQTKDTVWPEIHRHPFFKPFVEDQLPDLIKNQSAWVAHPYTDTPLPKQWQEKTYLAIGPEGGWVDFEIELFKSIGFQVGHFGARTLSTGVFVPAILRLAF